MEKWQWISLILCAFGIFKEFRPSEPFVTEYLIQYKNFTKATVVQVAYPIATYTYLGTLPILFLITDYLRYKSIIVLEAAAFVATFILLIWGHGLTSLKVVEVLYGIACSTEIAYYTYIYAKVDREQYKKVTAYTHTAIFVGNFVAAVVSQFLVTMNLMNYHELNYLTLASVLISLIIACCLPAVEKSMYFYRNIENEVSECSADDGKGARAAVIHDRLSPTQRMIRAYGILWTDFKKAYSNAYIVKWSIWWAIASAGYVQVVTYVQPLYETVYPSNKSEKIYNAGVDAIHTILSAVMALIVGHGNIPWSKWGELLLFVTSIVQGSLLIVMSNSESIVSVYCCYIAFRTSYQVMITVASSEVAQGISADSYGLIFGFNKFVSLVLQSTLTMVITDEKGLAVGERGQFLIYGIYFSILGVIFGIFAIFVWRNLQQSDSNVMNEENNDHPDERISRKFQTEQEIASEELL